VLAVFLWQQLLIKKRLIKLMLLRNKHIAGALYNVSSKYATDALNIVPVTHQ